MPQVRVSLLHLIICIYSYVGKDLIIPEGPARHNPTPPRSPPSISLLQNLSKLIYFVIFRPASVSRSCSSFSLHRMDHLFVPPPLRRQHRCGPAVNNKRTIPHNADHSPRDYDHDPTMHLHAMHDLAGHPPAHPSALSNMKHGPAGSTPYRT